MNPQDVQNFQDELDRRQKVDAQQRYIDQFKAEILDALHEQTAAIRELTALLAGGHVPERPTDQDDTQ